MNLEAAIEAYVERKHSDGLNFEKGEKELLSLSRYVGRRGLETVTTRHVAIFLDGPKTSPVTWAHKYGVIQGFFQFWLARGEIHVLPLPAKRKAGSGTFIPYIYTHSDIRALLKGTRLSQKEVWCSIEALTFRTLLIFLYATGALLGEAQRLRLNDVDFRKGMITIRSARFDRIRIIPIGPDLKNVLNRYAGARKRQHTETQNLFIDKNGKALNFSTLSSTFLRLRRLSGIVRHDGGRYQPRLHDLRHTFAVHRITAWMRHKADLNRMLPALAAYLGQAGLGSTERYLALTPERFRTQLDKLSPMHATKKWRDDPALMKFLAEL